MFKLNTDFVNEYKKIKPNFGFNGLGELTFYRTYSRLKADGKNENWAECIERVVNTTYNIQRTHILNQRLKWNEAKAQRSAQEMFKRIFTFKFTPPGRGFWAMNQELLDKVGSAALNNCFDGNTQFVTDIGLKTFKDVVGTYCNVLTKNGTYNKAKVESFGTQSLYEVTLKPFGLRSNLELKYNVTENHRWILKNGDVTTNLKVNDVISSKFYNQEIDETCIDFINGYSHGLIFGDGTRHTYYPSRHFIKVCDGQSDIYRPILSAHAGFKSETVGKDKYPVFTIISEENLKQLPDDSKNHVYLHAFIKGWMQADSHVHLNSQTYCLDTQNKEAADWVIKNAIFANLSVTGITIDNKDTNFGKRKNPLNRISLSPKECFYRVDKIEYLKEEEVFCVTEPVTSSFVLSSGLVTGNCGFTSTERMGESLVEATKPFKFLMDMSMLGVGIGFDVKGANKIKINEEDINLKSTYTFTVPDTREGWVESVEELLLFYFDPKTPYKDIKFDYSLVRPFGEPIKTFGGVASGHQPLEKLHNDIKNVLNPLRGKYITETAITDIMNMIGVCVVAGNVRRTAEIAFGSSEEFMDLKNYEKNPHRMNYGWTSNNSIFAELGQSYTDVSKRIALNGEPGIAVLSNMQDYSRMCEPKDYKDNKVRGGNPLTNFTL